MKVVKKKAEHCNQC